MVFDRGLRGTNAASRVLGVGHLLFDTNLEEARNLSSSVVYLGGLAAPLLVPSVEDDVTGTGALLHRLIFGITEKNGKFEALRDWELLKLLNACSATSTTLPDNSNLDLQSIVKRLKGAFDADLSSLAPTFRRPSSWLEMLLIGTADSTA